MLNRNEVESFLGKLSNDNRINVWHISLLIAVLCLWRQNSFRWPVKITRTQLMILARFKSVATYHKCLSKLVALGYVNYSPTFDSYTGSTIEINYTAHY